MPIEVTNEQLLILCIVSIVLFVLLALATSRLYRKLHIIMRGRDAKTLEDVILSLHKEVKSLREKQDNALEHLVSMDQRLKKSISNVSTIRFNPFQGSSGGGQSFASAFLSEEGDGVVLSSINARERMSLYAKPVSRYKSEYELTPEEQHAIEKSRKNP